MKMAGEKKRSEESKRGKNMKEKDILSTIF